MKSWRKSLRKSLAKRVSLRSQREDTLSNEIVKYKGVSLSALIRVRDGILQGTEAPGTELYVMLEDVEDVKAGRTVKSTGKNGLKEDEFLARVPFRKQRLVVKHSSVQFKERKDWTIEDVCEFVVLPNTLEDDSFYLECIGNAAVGKPFQGAFVSQARKSCFDSLVRALERHYEGKDPNKVFLWVDIFCANQPLLTRKDRGLKDTVQQERWTLLNSGLHQAIKHFDERLIFFNSWDDPYPLQRAWCIWEIYGAAASGKPLDIIFDPSASQDVVQKLMSDSGSLLQAIADMDPRKMECHDEKDLEMIRQAVEQLEGGFSTLKAKITERLRRWLLVTVEDAVKREDKKSGSHQSKAFADLLNHAGNFMADMDEKEVALSYYERAKDVYVKVHGSERHEDVGNVCNNMAIVYEKQGKYELALEMYEKALEIKKETLGERHPSTAQTYNNMAVVYEIQGKYELALEMYEKALEIRKETLGELHPSTATTEENIGLVFEKQGKIREAHEKFSIALRIRQETLGMSHPLTQKSQRFFNRTMA